MRATVAAIILAFTFVALQPLSPLCSAQFVSCDTGLLLVLLALFVVLQRWMNHLTIIALVAVLALHAQWGITQFIFQHDLGFQYVGESQLTPETLAVAKFSVGESKILRAYGPYQHANVFGAMMLIGILLTLQLPKCRARTILMGIFGLALLVSFSRAAFAGLIIAGLVNYRVVPRKVFMWLGVAIFLLLPLLFFRFADYQDQAVVERLRGYEWAREIANNVEPTVGLGIGQYVPRLQEFLSANNIEHAPWEVAPVHSVPFLLALEIGLIPLIGFTVALLVALPKHRFIALLPLLPALLVDHFFLTHFIALAWLLLLVFTPLLTLRHRPNS